MKVAFASDLHIEFDGHKVPDVPEGTDVLILAGDISSGGKGLQWAYETYHGKARAIIVVYGNHDYWGKHHYQKVIDRARAYASDKPDLFFLENNSICIDGVWFVGATAWTNFKAGTSLGQPLNMYHARADMRDYKKIKIKTGTGAGRAFKPEDALRINLETHEYIFKTLDEIRQFDEEAVTCVITHHGPTEKSLDDYYEGSNLNSCYVNDWGEWVARKGPHVWIHGHVHQEKAYKVHNTVVLCNPIGYPGQIRGSEIKSFMITTEDR